MTVIYTPAVTLRYPWLNKPDTKFDENGVYKTEFLLDPNKEDHAKFIAKIEDAHAEHVEAKRAELKKPRMKAADAPIRPDITEDGEETGLMVCRAKVAAKWKSGDSRKPVIVDSANVKTDANLYGGDIVRLKLDMYGWANPSVGIGLSLQPQAVQIIEKGNGGGGSDIGFDAIDGGYVSMDLAVDETTEEDHDY